MGANAQTSVPVFTIGQVLTAQQQTEINTGIPVFADSTARDAAFGGTGEKTLAEGQFAFLEDSDTTQYYDGSTWEAVGGASGLTLITAQTIGSGVATVTVSSVFSATYENYKIIMSGGVSSATSSIRFQLGATTTGYYAGYNRTSYSSGAFTGNNDNNAANFTAVGEVTTDGLNSIIELQQPFATKRTTMQCAYGSVRSSGFGLAGAGYLDNATSYTAFTISAPGETFTGGTIWVFGYKNS
jgi:hypothetical protein